MVVGLRSVGANKFPSRTGSTQQIVDWARILWISRWELSAREGFDGKLHRSLSPDETVEQLMTRNDYVNVSMTHEAGLSEVILGVVIYGRGFPKVREEIKPDTDFE
jgi:hypothetical protein